MPEQVETVIRVGDEMLGRVNTPMLDASGSSDSNALEPHAILDRAEAHWRWHRPSLRQPSPSGRRHSGVKKEVRTRSGPSAAEKPQFSMRSRAPPDGR